jgi:xanthine dehydrogenase accessory factor
MTIYQRIAELEEKAEPVVFCEVVKTQGSTPRHVGSKMLVFPDRHIEGTVGGGEVEERVIEEALKSFEDRMSRMVKYSLVDPEKGDPGICGGTMEVYVEPILPKQTLVVVGGGHVGRQVVHLAHWLGYYVIVSDDRPEFNNAESLPEADEWITCAMAELPGKIKINPYTSFVVVTRGSDVDIEGLGPYLDTPAGYIGVIGSRRRWEFTKKGLIAKGVDPEKFKKVHSPIGLELQAETPEEIAVSIIAEVMMNANRASGISMKKD